MQFFIFVYAILLPHLCLGSGLDLSPDTEHAPFLYGVASGDPLANAILLWTKIDSLIDVTVQWGLWEKNDTSANFLSPLFNGTVVATATSDWTIIQEVGALRPDTEYFYQFQIAGSNRSSVVGQTKTLPDPNSTVPVTIAVASCSSLWSGYFTTYRDIADNPTVDLVVHLGDYIYPDMASSGLECIRIPYGLCHDDFLAEDENFGSCRDASDPGEEFFHLAKINCTASSGEPNYLQRYRWTHALYLLDPNLRRARQKKPWVVIYDNHDQGDESGVYSARLQAFFEYVPHRHTITPQGSYVQSWRHFVVGKNLDLVMLDLRTWALNTSDFVGEEQWLWLQTVLNRSSAWRMIGTQVQFSPFALNDVHVVVDRVLVGLFMSVLTLTVICGCSLSQCRVQPRDTAVEFMSLNGVPTYGRSKCHRCVHDPHCIRCSRCCCMRTPVVCARCKCCVSVNPPLGCSSRCCSEKCVNPCCPPCRGCFLFGSIVVIVVIAIWIAAATILASSFGVENLKYLSASNRNWDGNPTSRTRMLDLIAKQQNSDNNFWVAGDMHFTVVSDIFRFDDSKKETLLDYDRSDFGGRRFGMEFLPASVTRGNLDEKVWQYTGWPTHSTSNVLLSSFLDNAISIMNPQYRYFDGSRHGYGVFTFSPTHTSVEIRFFPILDPAQPMEVGYTGSFTRPL